MNWPPDTPDIGIPKPKEVELLEKLEPHIREAMSPLERSEHVRDAALGIARSYKKNQGGGNYEGCLDIVSTALTITGSALGGKLGNDFIGKSAEESEEACRIVFDKPKI